MHTFDNVTNAGRGIALSEITCSKHPNQYISVDLFWWHKPSRKSDATCG